MSGVAEVLQETLRQLADRRRKLTPFVDELAELDIVEKDLRKTAAKLARRHGKVVPVPTPGPRAVASAADSSGQGGSRRERVIAALREHPQGLAGAKIAELAEVQGAQIYPLLAEMATGPSAVLDKVGRGFYRLIADIDGEPVDADLSEEEREELGDRAIA